MLFQNRHVQQILRQVHLWLGLVAGIFIVTMGLSGFVIVYRLRLERAAAPKVAAVPSGGVPASLDTIGRNLLSAYPGAKITRIVLPETASEPLLAQAELSGNKRAQIYFDPLSGNSLGERRNIAWLDWVVDLHQNLLMGKTGRALTGVIGAALLLVSMSGAFSWLAGSRDWRRSLALPQAGPWRRVNFQGHKWAGLWVNVLLVVISSTGMVLAWPDAVQRAIRAVTGEVPRDTALRQNAAAPIQAGGRTKRGLHKPLRALDEYVRAAAAAIPGGVVREVRITGRDGNSVSIAIRAPGDIRAKGASTVLLDPASAQVVSVELASAAPYSARFVELANAIHKTELGGLPVQLAWSLLGFAPALLFVSGLGIWWQRRGAKKRPLLARVEPDAAGEGILVHKTG